MSRIATLAEQIENGEPVDLRRVHTLLALDEVAAGEKFVAESFQQQKEADDRLANIVR